ncbi:hypothetical protein B0H15DRAFT_1027136 [Mycena belliarum]|uniref:Uncharacterized protein n=1 Tax=Mycena belliarum TaxID=1033014 RepID=A0AAD6XMD6_9AGAR|nr:hypothetical protein B0H15DRAFT_1027136 [Mycena belliae]
MAILLCLRILWKRLAMYLSPSSLRITGLWDAARTQNVCKQEVRDWRNELLLGGLKLRNVVVTQVEHLKDASDSKWQHEFLRVHVLHRDTGESLTLIVDRDFWPRDPEAPPVGVEVPGGNINPTATGSSSQAARTEPARELVPITAGQESQLDDWVCYKKDVPEEGERRGLIYTSVGKLFQTSTKVFSGREALDRVHRGIGDLEKRLSPTTLHLQSLIFPESTQPSVTDVAFFLTAVSEFAPKYHVGAFQCYWFARAACDGMCTQFQGELSGGPDAAKMGMWNMAVARYVNPSKSIMDEYKVAKANHMKYLHEVTKAARAKGHEEGGEERRRLEEEVQAGIEERRRLEAEVQTGIEERQQMEEERRQMEEERRRMEEKHQEELAEIRAELAAR